MGEEWKWVKGFEGQYQISNYGRVKSFKKTEGGYIWKLADESEVM